MAKHPLCKPSQSWLRRWSRLETTSSPLFALDDALSDSTNMIRLLALGVAQSLQPGSNVTSAGVTGCATS